MSAEKNGYTSFRTKLILYGVGLVLIVAAPVLYFEVQRPWDQLHTLISKTEALLDGMVPAFDSDEMQRLNRFTLEMIGIVNVDNAAKAEDYAVNQAPSHAFNMLLTEERLLTEDEVLTIFREEALDFDGFAYQDLEKWYGFWLEEFDARPGLLEIFRKYKRILAAAHANAVAAGFELADIYIMLDKDRTDSGFFKDNIAFVLESLPWWEASSPGEKYNLAETDTKEWRTSYARGYGGSPGFHHNRIFDPDNWYLPQFDTDEWGTWFSGWLAVEMEHDELLYNTYNIDFDASMVTRLMMNVAIFVAVSTLLISLIIFFTTRIFSQRLTRPITALIDGSEAVMAKKFNHVVPTFGRDEFKRLIEIFNRMIAWIREMINLKETLSKLLSEELAEKAAQEGLVLGGQQLDCSIMFTDFAGFSTLTLQVSAEEAVALLNFYFGELIPIVKKHGGFPDKFIGDAIVVIFGAPVRFEDHAERAVRCAIEMQKKMRQLNDQRRQEGKIVFEMRVGLNSGPVITGAIGCDLKLEYTSIGETTNLANRMEAKCQIGHVLMTETTYYLIQSILPLPEVLLNETPVKETVKGYPTPVSTYAIYVHDLEIEKYMLAEDPRNFYRYRPGSWK